MTDHLSSKRTPWPAALARPFGSFLSFNATGFVVSDAEALRDVGSLAGRAPAGFGSASQRSKVKAPSATRFRAGSAGEAAPDPLRPPQGVGQPRAGIVSRTRAVSGGMRHHQGTAALC